MQHLFNDHFVSYYRNKKKKIMNKIVKKMTLKLETNTEKLDLINKIAYKLSFLNMIENWF